MVDSNDPLPFGQSRWDYLPDLVQDHIVDLAENSVQRDLAAMELHQERMKDVCYSIKAHDHWVNYCYFPSFAQRCDHCQQHISPEFDMGRHRGICIRDTDEYDYGDEDEDEDEEFDWTTAVFSKELEDDIREWLLTMQHRTP